MQTRHTFYFLGPLCRFLNQVMVYKGCRLPPRLRNPVSWSDHHLWCPQAPNSLGITCLVTFVLTAWDPAPWFCPVNSWVFSTSSLRATLGSLWWPPPCGLSRCTHPCTLGTGVLPLPKSLEAGPPSLAACPQTPGATSLGAQERRCVLCVHKWGAEQLGPCPFSLSLTLCLLLLLGN